MTAADREKASTIESLWIDIGATSTDDARSRIEVGDAGVIEQPVARIGDGLIAARGMDNRAGAFVALEALRALAEDGAPNADVWAVAAAQEEIGLHGARTSAFGLEPDVAIVIDVSHATDHPEADVRGLGPRKLGGGAVLTRGSAVNPRVYEMLRDTARDNDIPWMIEPKPARTGTDADAISDSRAGVPTALVKIPTRYMHSSNELVSFADMDCCVRVIAGFVRRLDAGTTFAR
jgi:putative aminopeptidase FrvX